MELRSSHFVDAEPMLQGMAAARRVLSLVLEAIKDTSGDYRPIRSLV